MRLLAIAAAVAALLIIVGIIAGKASHSGTDTPAVPARSDATTLPPTTAPVLTTVVTAPPGQNVVQVPVTRRRAKGKRGKD
jgi:hypothetical protein